MQNCLQHIRDMLVGKTKEEIEARIASGEISFDNEKYRIVKNPDTLSGYLADFTDSHRTYLASFFGRKASEKIARALLKLDEIMSLGYEFEEAQLIEAYARMSDIVNGYGTRQITAYRFRLPDAENKGLPEWREVLLDDAGGFVKGTIGMAANRTRAYEQEFEEVIETQEFIMAQLGVTRRIAAGIMQCMEDLTDDEFMEKVETMYQMGGDVAKQMCIQATESDSCIRALRGKDAEAINNKLFSLIGQNGEYEWIVSRLCGKTKPRIKRSAQDYARENKERHELTYADKEAMRQKNAEFARDAVLMIAAGSVREILSWEDIAEYRQFVEQCGAYHGGFAKDISIFAEACGMEDEVLKFILRFGEYEDFKRYMTRTVYLTMSRKALCSPAADDAILLRIYKCLSSMDLDGTFAVSYRELKNAMDAFCLPAIRSRKEELTEAFLQGIFSGGYAYDLPRFVKWAAEMWPSQKGAADAALAAIKAGGSLSNLKSVLIRLYPSFDEKKIQKSLQSMKTDIKNLDEDSIRKGMRRAYGKHRVSGKKVIVERKFDVWMRRGAGFAHKNLYLQKQFQIPPWLAVRLKELDEEKLFHEKSRMLVAKAAMYGSDRLIEDGIEVMMLPSDAGYEAECRKGDLKCVVSMDEQECMDLQEIIELKAFVKKTEELLSTAIEAEKNGRDMAEFFGFGKRNVSPDEVLAGLIDSSGYVLPAAMNGKIHAECLMTYSGKSIDAPLLAKLQTMARKAYVDAFRYEGMLKNEQGLDFKHLFRPSLCDAATGMLIQSSPVASDPKGNVYIETERLFYSGNLERLYEKHQSDKIKSKKKLDEYMGMRERLDTGEDCWSDMLKFVRRRVDEEDVVREDLFAMLHDLDLKEDGLGWLRELLYAIDRRAKDDYKAYEAAFGAERNKTSDKL